MIEATFPGVMDRSCMEMVMVGVKRGKIPMIMFEQVKDGISYAVRVGEKWTWEVELV